MFIERLLERMSSPDSLDQVHRCRRAKRKRKSSLVRAGLVSAVRAGAIPGSEGWLVTEMHPGHHPLEELDAALMRVAVRPPAELLARLESGPRGSSRSRRRSSPVRGLLLVVDQLEEAFTLTESEDDRALLLESLRVATADPQAECVVATLQRADFYDRPLRYPRIGQLMDTSTRS